MALYIISYSIYHILLVPLAFRISLCSSTSVCILYIYMLYIYTHSYLNVYICTIPYPFLPSPIMSSFFFLYVIYEGDTSHVAMILVITISLFCNNICTRALTFNEIPFDDLSIFFFCLIDRHFLSLGTSGFDCN